MMAEMKVAGQTANDLQPAEAPTEPMTADGAPGAGEMTCPMCGSAMPDLKGGRATICPICGFKDSCCF